MARRRAGGADGDVGEGRHAKIDCGGAAGRFGIKLVQLAPSASEAHLEALYFTQPSFLFRLGDAGDQVVADVGQPWPLGWIRPEERASDTSFSEIGGWASQSL
ncbi:hypothetical protein ACNPQM_23965 [Streptomyces sp. NPDC056231]|uniref:hypothetical protein n=1 Tax=Streptomyces sp. NPDC056231 TaxID=3345755 RepID=UPI003AAE288E